LLTWKVLVRSESKQTAEGEEDDRTTASIIRSKYSVRV
jgi:hypothetical protein